MDIVEQLRRTELHHVWDDLEGKMVGKMFSANPDGPEAADEIERLQEALVEIVYQIGQGNNMAAMDIAAPIAGAYIQQKDCVHF